MTAPVFVFSRIVITGPLGFVVATSLFPDCRTSGGMASPCAVRRDYPGLANCSDIESPGGLPLDY